MANFASTGLDYSTPLSIDSRRRIVRSETLNLKTQTVSNDAQRWDLSITLTPTNNRESAPAGAALAVHRAVNGVSTSFTVEMPQYSGLSTTGTVANLRVNGAHTAGDETISVDGATNTTVIPAGFFITFSGHTKVYQVKSALNLSSASPSGTLNIFPALTANLLDNATIDTTPDITVYYANNGTDGVTYQAGGVVRATVNLIEALA